MDIPSTVSATITITPTDGANLQALYDFALTKVDGQTSTVTKDDENVRIVVQATSSRTIRTE